MLGSYRSEIPALTGVRGAAAVMVVVYHFTHPYLTLGSVLHRLLGHGYLYVDLFFILSGYVLALNYTQSMPSTPTISSVFDFLYRRFARIYPLYFALLVLGLALHGIHHHDMLVPPGSILTNVALAQTWFGNPVIVGGSWSISAEAAAYLLFPACLAITLHRQLRYTLLLLFAAAAALAAAISTGVTDGLYHAGTLDLYSGLPALGRCFGGFILGLSLPRLARIPLLQPLLTASAGVIAAGLYVAVLLANASDLFVYPLFSTILLSVTYSSGSLTRLCASPLVHRAGVLSYSMYLTHLLLLSPINGLADRLLPHFGALLTGITIVLLVTTLLTFSSYCLYRLIELPSRRFLLSARWRTPHPGFEATLPLLAEPGI